MSRWLRIAASALCSLGLCAAGSATSYFVSPRGSDRNPGTEISPFLTIQHAADTVLPGDTVIVQDGTYTPSEKQPAGKLVTVTRGGKPGALVTFRAQHKHRVILDGLNTSAQAWEIAADYIRIQDFEIRGFREVGVSNFSGGRFLEVVGNEIHHIGRVCSDAGIGFDAIFINAGPALIEANLLHDVGRYAAGENECSPATHFYQTNDHAIYIGGGNDVSIHSNVFYNNTHGWSVHVYPHSIDRLSIANNTFAFANPWVPGHIIVAVPRLTRSRIINNVFYQPKDAAIYRRSRSVQPDDLIIAGNISTSGVTLLDSSSGSFDPHVRYASNREHTDPRLVNPAANDFRPTPGSPALHSGMSSPDLVTDFEGHVRGSSPSVGAFEAPAP